MGCFGLRLLRIETCRGFDCCLRRSTHETIHSRSLDFIRTFVVVKRITEFSVYFVSLCNKLIGIMNVCILRLGLLKIDYNVFSVCSMLLLLMSSFGMRWEFLLAKEIYLSASTRTNAHCWCVLSGSTFHTQLILVVLSED